MRRLFLPNFDFEHQLQRRRSLPASVRRLNEELACAWLAVATDGDLIYTPALVERAFWEEMRSCGLPAIEPIGDLRKIDGPVELCPWGWTEEFQALGRKLGARFFAPSPAVIRAANSRQFSFDLEREWKLAPPGAELIRTAEQLTRTLAGLPSQAKGWVIKAEFGMSARERLLGYDRELSVQQAAWVRKRLCEGPVFLEPWLERVEEVGLQWTIPPLEIGPPVFEGVTPLLSGPGGEYRGSGFTPDPALLTGWDSAIETARRAAERLQQVGYFGPLGIDAMRYRHLDGTIQVRPLQDINARYTMGRLSLGFRRLLRPGERGEWWHVSGQHWFDSLPQPLPTAARVLRTSPSWVGGQPTGHGTVVIITG